MPMSVCEAQGVAGRRTLAPRLILTVLLLFSALVFSAVPAFAATTTIVCTEDTFISDAAPDYPGDVFGYTGVGMADGDTYRTLLRFNLTGVTGRVTSAKLRVYYYDGLGAPSGHIEVYRLKRAWSESQATWNEAATGNAWSVPGAMGADDADPTMLAQVSAPSAPWTWVEIPLNPDDVERLRNGYWANAGFLLRGDWETDPADQTHLYRGRTGADAPELVLTYDEIPVVSSPASSPWSLALAALMGIGGIAAFARTRGSAA
jgi:hypothetical protein